jgi:nucleotide-binding universal stress UspA family protein
VIRIQEAALDAPMIDRRTTPYSRVIAGIDFSPASLAGCRWAILHVARGADVMLSHVVPFEEVPGDGAGDIPTPSRVDSLRSPALLGGLGGFAATLDVASARTAVRVGRPSYWLDRLAAEFDASLVVVGRRQDAKRRRVGEASVVERLARRTSRSVLVVPEGIVDGPRCIVAAIDDGPAAAVVLAAATALAIACRQPLLALHVLPPASGTYDRVVKAPRTRADMSPVASRVPDETPWLAARVHGPSAVGGPLTLAVGDPAREIVAAGLAHGSGLLVVGKRGADDAPVGSLGSVARELLATSPLPVLAVEVPAR